MSSLKITTKTTHYVDYGDLEAFLTEKLGKEVQIIGSPNDTDYSVDVEVPDPEDAMFKWDEEERQEFVATGIIDLDTGSFHRPLSYAAQQKWIEPGSYVVSVSW